MNSPEGGSRQKLLLGAVRIAILLVALVVVAAAVAIAATWRPGYFSGYERLKDNYSTLQSSVHRGLDCTDCHRDRRGTLVYRAALVGDFYYRLFSDVNEPKFVSMGKPARDACRSCHTQNWSDDSKRTAKLPHPAHLRVASETRDCVGCHKWTAHEEKDMEQHKKMPFSSVCASFGCHVGWKQSSDCMNCHHILEKTQGEWTQVHPQTVRATGPNACLETCHTADQCRLCHTTGKTPVFSGGGVPTGVTAIEAEHVKPTWMSKHGSFALADQSKCMTCHVSDGECADCHAKRPAFHGPKSTWLAKHEALSKGALEKRCLTCHEKAWCEDCHKQFKEMR